MTKPYLNTETHRLTDLGTVRHPNICQLCGRGEPDKPLAGVPLKRWQEHDHNDRPENKIIVLCKECSDRVIEPHPRLYRELHDNQPWPGAMALCLDCKFRDGLTCTCPDAKANGGTGVMLSVPEPYRGFIDGAKYSGPFVIYPSPASACRSKIVA